MPTPGWSDYEAYVTRMMSAYGVPGAAVSVARHGKPEFAGGFGWRDREQGLPATAETVFGIGSITKSFTAVAILQLEEEGRLSVDDPVVKHLPEFRAGRGKGAEAMTGAITIHHLLTHTAGLPPLSSLFLALGRSLRDDKTLMEDPKVKESPLYQLVNEHEPIDTYEQLLAFIADQDVEFLGPPGTIFSYCNDGWSLLGAIIERACGRPYQDFVRERILEPLGMNRTTFDLGVMRGYPEVTTLYDLRQAEGKEEVYPSPHWWEAPAQTAAGFLRSCVGDLVRYLDIYLKGGTVDGRRILSPENVRRMCTPYVHVNGPAYYGYGLAVNPNYHGISIVEHGGGLKGIAAHLACVPEKGLAAAVLTNVGRAPAAQIAQAGLNLMLGLPLDTRQFDAPDYACPPERLARYTGVYRSAEGVSITVSNPGPGYGLVAEADGMVMAGRAIGVDTFAFRYKELESPMRFLTNPRGEVWAVHYGWRVVRKAK